MKNVISESDIRDGELEGLTVMIKLFASILVAGVAISAVFGIVAYLILSII